MGKRWDASGIAYSVDLWREVLRVLKPGGHLLAFGGSRTSHRLTCAVEDSGFEIRDAIQWIYSTGFPKSLDVSKAIDDAARQWEGYGTALKPAHEPITVARKPLAWTVAANVLEHGCGGLNIDGCRIGTSSTPRKDPHNGNLTNAHMEMRPWMKRRIEAGEPLKGDFTGDAGRWPSNVILDEAAAAEMDRQSGVSVSKPARSGRRGGCGFGMFDDGKSADANGHWPADEGGGSSRFFYIAKASRAERELGCQDLQAVSREDITGRKEGSAGQKHARSGNAHPTVKPLALMRHLVKLVTPPGGVVLEPFLGSGTTAMACVLEGFECVAIEREPQYMEIAEARIEWAKKQIRGRLL